MHEDSSRSLNRQQKTEEIKMLNIMFRKNKNKPQIIFDKKRDIDGVASEEIGVRLLYVSTNVSGIELICYISSAKFDSCGPFEVTNSSKWERGHKSFNDRKSGVKGEDINAKRIFTLVWRLYFN